MKLIAQYYNEQKEISVDVFTENNKYIVKNKTFDNGKQCDRFLKEHGYICYRIILGGIDETETKNEKN